MSDSKRFLQPEVLQRISRLDLRARHVVEGFLAGMHRSPYFGQSVEFLQHRQYAPGDDLRHVDWKVWGRQDRLFLKQYEEESNLPATLLVDVSRSMHYGAGPLNKFDCAATIAASLAWLLLKQQDGVGCVTFDERIRQTVPVSSRHKHLETIAQALAKRPPERKTSMTEILAQVAEAYPGRGMMVLISDLLVERQGLLRGLKLLRQRGHDVLVLHVMDDDELDFPFTGPTRFVGLESEDQLNCNPRALREGYLAELQKFLDEVRRGCARETVDYALLRTRQPLDAALAAYLNNRLGMHHRN